MFLGNVGAEGKSFSVLRKGKCYLRTHCTFQLELGISRKSTSFRGTGTKYSMVGGFSMSFERDHSVLWTLSFLQSSY